MMNATMQTELSVSLNFVISYLYNKLPRRRVDMFCEELEKGLRRKFEGHWYPDEPFKGSGFRSVRLNGEKVDPVVAAAAEASGLSVDEVQEYLPKSLTVWMDPGEVSYRTGENTPVKILYRRPGMIQMNPGHMEDGISTNESFMDREVQRVSPGFNPCAESFMPTDRGSLHLSLSASPVGWTPGFVPGTSGSSSPSAPGCSTSPIMGPYFGRTTSVATTTSFTAATFAQTKFGSTKMKFQAQRPTRLSPTELAGGMFVSPAGVVAARSPVSPLGPNPPQLSAKLSPGLPSPLGGAISPGLLQLSPVHQQQLMANPFMGLYGAYPKVDYLNEQQRAMLMQQQQLQMQRIQQHQLQQQLHQQHQQQLHLEQMRRMQANENLLSQESANDINSSSNVDNSISASLQLFCEKQILLQQQQQQQQPQQQQNQPACVSPLSEVTVESPESEFPSSHPIQKSHDPFRTDRSQSGGGDALDWDAFVTPFTGGLHQLLVAN